MFVFGANSACYGRSIRTISLTPTCRLSPYLKTFWTSLYLSCIRLSSSLHRRGNANANTWSRPWSPHSLLYSFFSPFQSYLQCWPKSLQSTCTQTISSTQMSFSLETLATIHKRPSRPLFRGRRRSPSMVHGVRCLRPIAWICQQLIFYSQGVLNKTANILPPSGDKHDYLSWAP